MIKKPALRLETPIRYVKGVGPKMAQRLKKIDIKTVKDLVCHFPFRHQDYSIISSVDRVQAGETVTLIGQIVKINNTYTRSSRQRTVQRAVLEDSTGSIEIVWFNQPYLINTLVPPITVSVSGKVRLRGNRLQLTAPDFEILEQGKRVSAEEIGEEFSINTGRLIPVYPLTFGISNKYLRRLIARVLPLIKDQIEEFLPQEVIIENGLISEREAILAIHFPENEKVLKEARRRLAFDELFLLQLRCLTEKKQWQEKQPAPKIKADAKKLNRFINSLPFKLTQAQERAIKEIVHDLNRPVAMNRLLQGDVGSGKTIVAIAASLIVAQAKYQSVFMVPTEILAQQHYNNFKKLLEPLGIKLALITSSTSKKINPQKKVITDDLIIGTHALIHRYARFNRVGLVVIDEQHRFGVSQRGKLIKKSALADKDNLSPHILTMTATPIPRTITLTVYGDLDISTLDEMPSGRKEIKTYLVPASKREKCYQWVKKNIDQAFIVCPLIEESETLESVKAATTEYQRLKKEVFPELKLDLIHGRMKSKEKTKVLEKMLQGKTDILVATPVVEVGIDLPRANIMIIEAADRFGLAQLHQIRGRVGRNKKQGYCFLFAGRVGKKSRARLRAMEETNDGMRLAETDLEIRGPGEIYGTKQHGFPEFKIASYADLELTQRARKAAEMIIKKTPSLNLYPKIKEKIEIEQSGTIAPN